MPPGTKKTSISLDPELEQRAKERAAQRGFKYSFSAYVAELIREDLKTHARAEEKPAITYPRPQRALPRRPAREPNKNS